MTIDVPMVGGGSNGFADGPRTLARWCAPDGVGMAAVALHDTKGQRSGRSRGYTGLDFRGPSQPYTGSKRPPQPEPGLQSGAPALDNQPMYRLLIPQRRIEEILPDRSKNSEFAVSDFSSRGKNIGMVLDGQRLQRRNGESRSDRRREIRSPRMGLLARCYWGCRKRMFSPSSLYSAEQVSPPQIIVSFSQS